jgi:hypothetical protein
VRYQCIRRGILASSIFPENTVRDVIAMMRIHCHKDLINLIYVLHDHISRSFAVVISTGNPQRTTGHEVDLRVDDE